MTLADIQAAQFSKSLKQLAMAHGFFACGISKAETLTDDARRLEAWLGQGRNAHIAYMEQYFDERIDPRKLVPGAKSVVSLLFNYSPAAELSQPEDAPKVARYAWMKDYHWILKPRLKSLKQAFEKEVGAVIDGRVFVDSAPILERAWAMRSGIGWVGKNANLLTKQHGSYFFIAELILDIHLQADGPATDHCGSCTRCIDACPTNAIVAPTVIDANRCITALTVELQQNLNSQQQQMLHGWAFGCDICQEVCPWNRFAKPHNEAAFAPNLEMLGMTSRDWEEMTDDVFMRVFKGNPVKRAGLAKIKSHLRPLKATTAID